VTQRIVIQSPVTVIRDSCCMDQNSTVAGRVVSWEISPGKFPEISPGKFPEIYSNLSGNLLKNFSLYTF